MGRIHCKKCGMEIDKHGCMYCGGKPWRSAMDKKDTRTPAEIHRDFLENGFI